jgi:hypothetical protein
MANILDLLNSPVGKTLINGTSQQLGQNKAKTKDYTTQNFFDTERHVTCPGDGSCGKNGSHGDKGAG